MLHESALWSQGGGVMRPLRHPPNDGLERIMLHVAGSCVSGIIQYNINFTRSELYEYTGGKKINTILFW